MKLMKAFALSLLTIAWFANAKINVGLGVVRKGIITIGETHLLELKQPSVEVYRDESTYVEAELMSEKDSIPVVRFLVASKNETGSMVVRGMPQLSTSILKGLGMHTLQCDGNDESFTLVVAVSKAE